MPTHTARAAARDKHDGAGGQLSMLALPLRFIERWRELARRHGVGEHDELRATWVQHHRRWGVFIVGSVNGHPFMCGWAQDECAQAERLFFDVHDVAPVVLRVHADASPVARSA